jgi:ParB/RepB/Spo0J family partition protein
MSKPTGRARLDLSGLDGTLSALTAVADSGAPKNEVGSAATIAMELIDEDVSQPRQNFNPETLRELAESIRAVGLQNPVIVQPRPDGRYLLLQGGRRFRACKQLGMTEIKALFVAKKDTYAQMVENLQRDDLTPMEIAHFVGGEISRGAKQTEIATRLGKSKVWVSKYATLARAPDFVMSAAVAGKLPSMEGIYELVTHLENVPSDSERIESLVEAAESLTRNEIVRLLSGLKVAPKEAVGEESSSSGNDESEVITGELSNAGRGERLAGDGDTGTREAGLGVRKHANNLSEQRTSSEARDDDEGDKRGNTPGADTLPNRSSSEGAERGTNVPRGKPAAGGQIRKARLMANFGKRKVEIDLTRLPADAKFYVRFVDGTGEAVANGDALSDLALSDA